MVIALVISFSDWDGLNEIGWVGVDNYVALFSDRVLYPYFWQSLLVSVEYILLTVPVNIVLSLVVSALLNSKIKAERFFKTAFYIPSVTVGVAVMALWKFMLDPTYGMINQILGTNINFLGTEGLNLVTLAVMSVWGGLGYNVLIMLSAMKNIDNSLYEAASIDGANAFQKFWNITVPGVMPTVFFFLVTGVIGGFQAFEQMYLMTGAGINHSTYTYVFGVYEQAMTHSELGIGSAMSFILFAFLLILTLVQFRALPKDVDANKKKKSIFARMKKKEETV
ncbi:MAG: sugar ABC transporter permease [Clostridia bacterium]|nr:sugar ABC transporter permease [Clostridia bacterium]